MVTSLRATFITMFEQPIKAWLDSSIIARARQKAILDTHIESILDSVGGNHHKVDDTPYGGGPGELMRIDVIEPLISQALARHPTIERQAKRVILLDPAGKPFDQAGAKRLARYQELIFVCGRYEGIDARIHHYVDEAISVGDFVLSSGDVAAMVVFDSTARMIEGVLGNLSSIEHESHFHGRLESSHYTRPIKYQGHLVPQVYQGGNHKEIEIARERESIVKTAQLRPDLVKIKPLSDHEIKLLMNSEQPDIYPWQKNHE
jgi:tRNA (guanine37-N1)-methyltransferase